MAGIGGAVERHPRLVAGVFFAVLLAVGLSIFDDYGVSWDERVQRKYGGLVYDYVVKGDESLLVDRHRFYGPVIEFSLYALERALALEDTREIYLMRHLVTFLIFWLGTIFFFLLCRDVFRSRKVGLLGSFVLVVTPRIFAHAFYNSKDIPFMVLFIVAMYTLLRYLERATPGRTVVHALTTALLIATRVVGVLVPVITLGFVLYGVIPKAAGGSRGAAAPGASGDPKRADSPGDAASTTTAGSQGSLEVILSLVLYLALSCGLTVILWPTLWTHTLRNFAEAFRTMNQFPWEAKMLYLGKSVRATELPWHYTWVWIAISTPLSIIAAFLVGLVFTLRGLIRPSQHDVVGRRTGLVFLVWFFVPLAYIMLSRAVVYDAWRHTFFVYPALVGIALVGILRLWRFAKTRMRRSVRVVSGALIVGIIGFNLAFVARFMIQEHPYQNLYFNMLVGGIKGAQDKFELDYWGLSYREGLEYLLRTDHSDTIKVSSATRPGSFNLFLLTPEERARIEWVERGTGTPTYYLTNLRWGRPRSRHGQEIYAVTVDGVKIMVVYRVESEATS